MNISYLIYGCLTGYLLTALYEYFFRLVQVKTSKKPIVRFRGWHLHHSLYSIPFIIMAYISASLFLFGAGLGIKIRHIQSEKSFSFIDRS